MREVHSAVGRRLVLSLAPTLLIPLHPLRASAKPALDAASRFALDIPDDYVVSKRKATTGTLFVAGNFPRFSVVSVTAWPLPALLLDDARGRALPGLPTSGADVTLAESATTLGSIGTANSIAQLLLRARDRDASSGALSSILLSSKLSDDGSRLAFDYSTELPVSDPDALQEQRGVRQLIRHTVATSILGSVPGSDGAPVPAMFSVWASALQQDWEGDLREPLEATVASFSVAVKPPTP